MDFNTTDPKKQEEIREYYDKKAPLKKRPYHFFASKNRKKYQIKYPDQSHQEISKVLTKAWKKLKFETYVKFIRIAIGECQSILTNQGFELYKPLYPDTFLQEIRKDLTVKPRVAKGYGPEPDAYDLYIETKDKMIIPRYYGYTKLENAKNIPNKLSKGKKINLKFNGKLRDYQEAVVNKFEKIFHTIHGGLIVARCAFGKTVVAGYIITMLQRKTLVIVHKENLLLQWKERIQEYLPDARIGKIQGSTIDVENKDIVIGMVQSLCKKDYGDLFSQFGLLICDEAHRMGAKEFCKALRKASTFYTLGLTATPNRTDGLTKVFKWYLGDTGYVYNKATEFDVTVNAIYYSSQFYEEKKLYSGGYNFANMIGQIVNEKKRTDMIVDMVRKFAKQGRQTLIIGHRINLLRTIHKLINGKNKLNDMVTSGFYIGGMKEVELIESTKQQVILGSFSMIEEGADIKTLDTIVLATPKSTVQQAVGRIMRQQNKHDPLIVDIIDDFSIFPNQANKRRKYYEKEKYTLTGYKNQVNEKQVKLEVCAFNSDSDEE